MANNEIKFKKALPDKSIKDFVECFWMVENKTNSDKKVIVLPDANFDLVVAKSDNDPLQIWLIGLNTIVKEEAIKANTTIFLINFKLISAEYLFNITIANFTNKAEALGKTFWGFNEIDLNDFENFCLKATLKITQILPETIDCRKQKLFELIYVSNGSLTVREFSEKVFWCSRQINRYFTKYFGISLKEYCGILRFRALFEQINEGELFPEQNFSDQPHFSREVKRLSGVNPRELFRSKNDRFIQVSLIGSK